MKNRVWIFSLLGAFMSYSIPSQTAQICPSLSIEAKKIKSGIYRHYKGNLYRVVGVGLHEETHEELVMYQALYGNFEWWVRSLEKFIEEVEYEGKTQPRFSFVGVVKNDGCC